MRSEPYAISDYDKQNEKCEMRNVTIIRNELLQVFCQ